MRNELQGFSSVGRDEWGWCRKLARNRASVGIAGLILALGLAGTLHARFTLSGFSEDELERRALALSLDLEDHASELLLTNDVYGLYSRINELVLNNDDVRYVVVFDAEGNVRASTFPQGLPLGLRQAQLRRRRSGVLPGKRQHQ